MADDSIRKTVNGQREQVTPDESKAEGTGPETAVLLLGYGGPDCLESVEPFITRLMGRTPEPAIVEQVKRRYLAIGGCSPTLPITQNIASGIEQRLIERGHNVPVAFGMRYAPPFIDEVLRGMHEFGIRRVVTVSLSPYASAIATGAAKRMIDETLAGIPDMQVVSTDLLHTLPTFGALLVGGVATALHDLTEVERKLAVFTAHSLPVSDVEKDDSYVTQLRGMLDRIIESLGMPSGEDLDGSAEALPGIEAYGNLRDPQPWVFAYQSKGRKPGEWLGPDLQDVLEAADTGGFTGIALCPIGFAIDNMETVYDLDVEAADWLVGRDLQYSRADLPNDDPLMLDAITEMIEGRL